MANSKNARASEIAQTKPLTSGVQDLADAIRLLGQAVPKMDDENLANVIKIHEGVIKFCRSEQAHRAKITASAQ